MTTQELDMVKLEAFGGQVLGMLTGSYLINLISIGHRTGLFDALAVLPPATSEQIAAAAGLNERYVREWLAALSCARILDYDPATATFWLPPEHAAMLTRAAGPNNFARFAQFGAQFGLVEDRLVECFRRGGGLPYSAYTKFGQLMAELSGEVFDARLIDSVRPLLPGVVDRLRRGLDVADIGCGHGHAINLLAREFPASRFTGYDFLDENLAVARNEAVAWGLTNARFVQQDVATLAATAAYDVITAFDTIHDQAHPARVLANVARALRSGGHFLMVDVAASSNLTENLDHPMGALYYATSTVHCMSVSLGQGGDGLGTMWGEQTARRMLAETGLAVEDVARVEGDIQNNYYICRKP